ncbi:anthranilate synthase family protein [Phytohabitans aurantiacus]|uniref:anthranilate synthase n=1 Tax=Phytohabitans aurantiacus TaxID=3016789 RepID=A0ABQ5R1Y3_9ACTN|nr:anthranilate synthase family protein [Phytohabitans aurantiacus]GLH99959.1 phenazine-specific anthranilate synthase component I [Phytohabitans aurantiacus]
MIDVAQDRPFALIHRPGNAGPPRVTVLTGRAETVPGLADLSLPDAAGGAAPELVALLPYRLIAERGFASRDDGEPIRVLRVEHHAEVPLAEALDRLPDEPVSWREQGFDIDDDEYATIAKRIIDDEIGAGAGSNFVIKRSFRAQLDGAPPRAALALFRRLLRSEPGAYWTFVVHLGDRTFVGATPERHASLDGGTVVMNPISGTFRYPPAGPTLPDVLDFLGDEKETDELYMVVDEELKMMARLCPRGGRVVGPYLKEMARLAHTEYLIEGRTELDVRDVLRETMFAPTVTGSPLENACRVIAHHEPTGRGYYAGAIALIGRDGQGGRWMDSAILIRTADIDRDGGVRIGAGSTLVRHSDPASEAAETWAKVSGLLKAASADAAAAPAEPAAPGLACHAEVRGLLERRNATMARYWFTDPDRRADHRTDLAGVQTLVVDAEDTFTAMLAGQLDSLGLAVRIEPWHRVAGAEPDPARLVVLGPGPGDPRDREDPRVRAMARLAERLVHGDRPFLAVCLGHQVVAGALGLELVRRPTPNQGVQRTIDLFGELAQVGFYNTFAARAGGAVVTTAGARGPVRASRDPRTGEVHALRGRGFVSLQFHPESLLSRTGPDILAGFSKWALNSTDGANW